MSARFLSMVLAAQLAFAPAAFAEPKKSEKIEAKAAYESGISKFKAGKYDDAATDFGRAFELVGEPAILYNVAQSYRLSERFEKAAAAYRSFLSHLPAESSSRPEVEGRIVEMDERAADEKRRADRARLDARHPQVENREPHVDATQHAGRAHPTSTLKIVGYSLAGLTGATLGTGIAMSVLSAHASSDVQHAANAHATFTSSLADTQSNGKTYDKVQIAMYTIAGVAAVGAAVSLALGLKSERRSDKIARAILTGRF